MNPATQRIQEIQERGYEFNLGTYLQQGFDIFRKQPGLFIAYTLAHLVIVGLASIIPVIGTIGANIFLSPCLVAGYLLIAHRIRSGETAFEFGDFFKGFDYFGKLVVIAIFSALIVTAAAMPFVAVAIVSGIGILAFGFSAFPFWMFFLLIPVIYLAISYSAAPFFAIFYKMEAWEAMEASRKVVSKQWFMVFLFTLVLGLIAGLGAICLFVGMLVTIPVMFASQYAAFADIMQLNAINSDVEADDEDVMRHLV